MDKKAIQDFFREAWPQMEEACARLGGHGDQSRKNWHRGVFKGPRDDTCAESSQLEAWVPMCRGVLVMWIPKCDTQGHRQEDACPAHTSFVQEKPKSKPLDVPCASLGLQGNYRIWNLQVKLVHRNQGKL